ncbi:MAG TPA: hypothetical protein VEA80_14735 [Vitreimonas sp.]|uniref:hypothetical protein n=1 Tax=Vitreimonas sp. TaxID=3069702 RepID=UPI002D4C079B|nr:hypothetical protein [Vitreimonas sp.]HYD88728.1 hypothetical protein [Vitreimonas sp.]
MYFDQEDDERDPFAAFGDLDATNHGFANDDLDATVQQPAVVEPETQTKVKTGFSWAGFMGGAAALVWVAGAIGGPLSYFGVDAIMTMDPAMQAGLVALAIGPALLFWVTASAAGEALKTRRIATQLTQKIAHENRFPTEAAETHAQRLSETVKTEIESLNDAVASAMDRLAELERAAQRNAALIGEAVAASRESAETMTQALKTERDAIIELNSDLRGQTDTIAHSIGRQVRLMREASKMVKTEVVAAEDALESHLAAFTASATVMGERTAHFHIVADKAAAATTQLNGSMTEMLSGLAEATRLTETAKKSTAEAVLAANETAGAVRETTRAAVFEAKRAAQLIRAETVAMQEAANDTLAKLQDAANAAREASVESEAAADRYTAQIEKRLGALASAAGGKKAAAPQRPVERAIERTVERKPQPVAVEDEVTTLHAAARAAVARGAAPQAEVETQTKRVFKGFGSWGNFMPPAPRDEEAPVAANEDGFALASFGNPDDELKAGAINLVLNSGVDIDDVLQPLDLERIARSSREGASARRRAVVDAAPGAVGRIARHVKRSTTAQELASQFRSRPDLAKSEKKGEGSELVRAYLLIDAALAS